jgi:hypothetical protein
MVQPRSKSEELSETTKTYLSEVYVNARYNRRKELTNRYIEKGLAVEEDSITLYSRVKKIPFFKNEQHFANDYIQGTPDHVGDFVLDIKSNWDIFTFTNTFKDDLNKKYYWQLMGYMALTGKKEARLAYCLVNTPDVMIEDEKRRLAWKMGLIDPEANLEYIKACKQIELLSLYDDIPLSERVNEIVIPYDALAIESLYNKIIACRQYMADTWPKFFREPVSVEE